MSVRRQGALPKGWEWATVQSLAKNEAGAITDGPFGSNLKTSHYTDHGPRVIRLQNIGDGLFRDERAHISEAHFERLRRHNVADGDVLTALLGERLPRACLTPHGLGPTIVKADCVRVRPDPDRVNPIYLMYALNDPDLQRAVTPRGVGRPRLRLQDLRRIEVPLAPRPEQDLIVSEIEKHFTRLDAAVAELDGAQAKVNSYRSSLLHSAVTGTLSAQWRQEHDIASTIAPKDLLPKLQLEQSAEPFGIPRTWSWVELHRVAELINGDRSANYPSKERRVQTGVPFINAGHLRRGRVDTAEMDYISEDTFRLLKGGKVQRGDVLYCLRGSLGKAALVTDINRAAIASSLLIMRPRAELNARYLLHYLCSPLGLQMVRTFDNGTAQPNLSAKNVGRYRVPLPPHDEQMAIVDALDRYLSVAEQTGNQLESNRGRASALRNAILRAAFAGLLRVTSSQSSTLQTPR